MADVFKLLGACNTVGEKALIVFCGLMGMRISEALSIRPSSFDLKEMKLRVLGKGEKYRDLPVTNETWNLIALAVTEAWIGGTDDTVVGYSDRGARRKITTIGKRAGITRAVASHDLRMTFATHVYAQTKDIRTVQLLLGHNDIAVTQRYVGIEMQTMREAVTFR